MDKNSELIVIGSVGIIAVIGIAYLMNRKPKLETSTTVTASQSPPITIPTTINPTTYSNAPGTQSNPYLYDNGYQGAGYYLFTSQEFSKLSSIPASGITLNPTYMDNLAFYQGLNYWLSYTGSITVNIPGGTVQSSSTQVQTQVPTSGMHISVSPSSISLVQGATITISGTGFVPYSKGMLSANNIGIAGFTADANGNFNVSASYYFNQNNVSGLGNAIKDATGNYIDIIAYDYSSGTYSNKATLYFA